MIMPINKYKTYVAKLCVKRDKRDEIPKVKLLTRVKKIINDRKNINSF